jgi:hypothetical protein
VWSLSIVLLSCHFHTAVIVVQQETVKNYKTFFIFILLGEGGVTGVSVCDAVLSAQLELQHVSAGQLHRYVMFTYDHD